MQRRWGGVRVRDSHDTYHRQAENIRVLSQHAPNSLFGTGNGARLLRIDRRDVRGIVDVLVGAGRAELLGLLSWYLRRHGLLGLLQELGKVCSGEGLATCSIGKLLVHCEERRAQIYL
jgi:hypothetical protein